MMENRGELYYFSKGQLILLAVAFMVTSAFVFFLGMWIGQAIEERKIASKEEPLIKIPVEPLTQESPAAPGAVKEELSFYDTLTKAAASPVTPAESLQESKQTAKAETAAKEEASPKDEKTLVSPKEEENNVKQVAAVWSVQVNAFPTERDAQKLAKRLLDKGYEAYVASTEIKGKSWYRVRVGRFASIEEARDLLEALKAKEKMSKAITVLR